MTVARTPEQAAYITATVARMKSEIIVDVKADILPATVTSYGDLHDYVDANGYGGMFEESDPESAEGRVLRGLDLVSSLFPDPEGSGDYGTLNSQAGMDVCNEMQTAVHEWIAAGGIGKALESQAHKEFSDFDVVVEAPEGFIETSWHNDAMPSWSMTGDGTKAVVWVNYFDAARREMETEKPSGVLARVVAADQETTLYEGADIAEAFRIASEAS